MLLLPFQPHKSLHSSTSQHNVASKAALAPTRLCHSSRKLPTRARVPTRCSSEATSTSASGSNSDDADEAASRLKRLQRCNSIQRSYLDKREQQQKQQQEKEQEEQLQQDDASLSCWGAADLPRHHTSRRGVTNQVQLSVYPDAVGQDLADLNDFLRTHVDGAVGSVHLLPLYPSTGDRGFAPVTYQQVDPQYGSWSNVKDLSAEYQLCLEYMVNHISPASPQFQDYLKHGEASPYSDMFVKWEDIWPGGRPSAQQLACIRTRKPAPPVLEVQMADGSVVPLWNTFSDQQIDINPFSEEGWRFTEASLRSLCTNGGAKLIRLDAFGYVTKKAGTSCFMEEPEVWELLERIRSVVKPFGVQLLCEVHECFKTNIKLASHGYWVYDFALPMLLLHALRFKTAESLKHWLSICPRRQITTLDTHDGMGVDDVAGLAPLVDVQEVEQCLVGLGGTVNYKHFYEPDAGDKCDHDGADDCRACSISSQKSLQAVKECLQPDCLKGCYTSVEHQYNATYFSAVREDPQTYLLARAVQFFTPGVPMLYYVGLLAGRNDYELLQHGSIRDINRHYFSLEEAEEAVKRPVVQALLKLCRFRNYHPAFRGRVFIDDSTPPHLLRVAWYLGSRHLAILRADFQAGQFSISHTPYKSPLAADESVEDAEVHSDYSLDLQQVLSIDAMDLVERAQTRINMAPCATDTGIVDPEQLLQARKQGVGAGNGSSSNGGSTRSRSNGASVPGSGSAPVPSTATGGSYDGADDATPKWVAASNASRQQQDGQEEDRTESGDEELTSKESEFALLQLDLSFAWRLTDEPLKDVEGVLEGAVTAGSRSG